MGTRNNLAQRGLIILIFSLCSHGFYVDSKGIEFNQSLSCLSDAEFHVCSVDLPSHCNATLLDNRYVHLSCTDNDIRSRYNISITYPENITVLDLSRQNVVEISEKAFINLTLIELDISNNMLSTIHPLAFSSLNILRELYLSYNDLQTLEEDLFDGLLELTVLHLNENLLSRLQVGLLKDLRKLEILYLRGNNLQTLEENVFDGLSELTVLHLHRNSLTRLPVGLLKDLGNLDTLYLQQNMLEILEENIFDGLINLRSLSLRDNILTFLPKQLFHNQHNLMYLYLYRNDLRSFGGAHFEGTPRLQILMVHTNALADLSDDVFWNMQTVTYISLGSNMLTNLQENTFKGLTSLEKLFLFYNQLRVLDAHLFDDLTNLRLLFLHNNQLTNIPNINHLTRLIYINLIGNHLTIIDKHTFDNLSMEVEIAVSQTEVCECYVPRGVYCAAIDYRSPYLTCDRLLSDRVLVAMMWLIGLNALGGNLFVISRKKTKNEKAKAQSLFLTNLAISDLLMGIYMLIIASADIYFGEHFPMQAETWRSGITCKITGAISIISSEASVFFVTLVSIDRFINIRLPYSRLKLQKKSSIVLVLVLWLIALALAIPPSVVAGREDWKRFYDNSHVCIGLPLAQIEKFFKTVTIVPVEKDNYAYYKHVVTSESLGHVASLYYSSAVFLGLNGICYFVILICYTEIVRFVFKSSKRAGLNKDMKEQIRMTLKVAAVVLTDFFCWAPVIVMGVLVQVGVTVLPPAVFAWSVAVILPINSAINPYLYTIAGIISNRRKQARITPSGNQEESRSHAVSQTSRIRIDTVGQAHHAHGSAQDLPGKNSTSLQIEKSASNV